MSHTVNDLGSLVTRHHTDEIKITIVALYLLRHFVTKLYYIFTYHCFSGFSRVTLNKNLPESGRILFAWQLFFQRVLIELYIFEILY